MPNFGNSITDENKLTADAELTKANFTRDFYNTVNEVIGGDNPNQILTLLLPGIALSPEDFEYDYKNSAAKGPVVEANESRIANKLYDPFHISGADNGRTLPYQYKSSLDALTPKLNPFIADAKNILRRFILTKYPYQFDKDKALTEEINTFQEVFFKLYDEYVAEMTKWASDQTEQKNSTYEKVQKDFKENGKIKNNASELTGELLKEFNKKVNSEYLTWYETVAPSRLNVVNQKMSKLLSVFSVNDMKILEGILDSGSGAELQEARQTMTNIRKLTPEGGYVYPVKFNPTNWFEQLGTSFTPIDLLDSPMIISEKLGGLYHQKINLLSQYNSVLELIPDSKTLKSAKDEYDKCYKAVFDTSTGAFTALEKAGRDGLTDFTNSVLGLVCGLAGSPKVTDILSTVSPALKKGKDISDVITSLSTGGKNVSDALGNLNNAFDSLTNSQAYVSALEGRAELKNAADMLKTQLDHINKEISDLEIKVKMAATTYGSSEEAVAPNTVPPGYSSFYISHTVTQEKEATDETVTVSTNVKSSGFWVFKTKKQTTNTETEFEKMCASAGTNIEIGMNIAKVGIEREWFNPGVFVLSDDMYHLTDKTVSESFDAKNYNPNNYIFPCYPVAMLLGRDITIKYTTNNSSFYSSIQKMESQASKSKGLLFFNKGSGSKTTTTHTKNEKNEDVYSVVIRIPTPQIIGYYLENVPADNSDKYPENSANTKIINTITDFVKSYKEIIDANNDQLNKK